MIWIIWIACITHLTWGAMLITNPDPIIHINALEHMLNAAPFDSPRLLGVLLIAISISTIWSFTKKLGKWDVIFSIPQQCVMVFSAAAAISSGWTGQFADGALYDGRFIFADQCWHIYAGAGHTAALLSAHGPGKRAIND